MKKKNSDKVSRILVYSIFILLFFIVFLFKPKIIGYTIVEKSINYTQELNWEINSSSEKAWFLEHPGDLKSVRLGGSMSKDGSAKIYIEHNDETYLIFDSNQLTEEGGIGSITGAVVAENNESEEEAEDDDVESEDEESDEVAEETDEDEEEESEDEEEIEEEEADEISEDEEEIEEDAEESEDEEEIEEEDVEEEEDEENEEEEVEVEEEEVESDDNTIAIDLEYKSGSLFDSDDDGSEIITGAIDFTIENSEFNWDVNESNLCTKWETYSLDNEESTTVCYGSETCCNFIELAPTREDWDEAFYLTHGLYGATLNNKISSQVIYVDYSLDPEDPYSYIYYSDWTNLSAEFYYERISFSDICIDTCLVSGFNESFYNLVFEIEGNLIIDSIGYTVAEEKVNEAPVFSLIPNQTINLNGNITLNLSDYAYDPDNDSLAFTAYKTDNLTVLFNGYNATIVPDKEFEGRKYMFFIANDSIATTVSNVFSVIIAKISKPKVEEKTVQVFAEIGKPVKWVKNVKLNESVGNLTVNVTKGASNITVKKIVGNQPITVGGDQIKIIENDTIKPLEEYNNPITGGVVAGGFGQGYFTKLLNMRAGITGAAVGDISVDLTDTNVSQVVIEDNATEYEIEYYTDAPQATEINLSLTSKQVVISSTIPYENVLSYTDIIESPAEGIRIYWYVNETEYNDYMNITSNKLNYSSDKSFKLDITDLSEFYVSFIDQNSNDLIDKVQWVAPHLSNQTFEISIDVLNVQSYPMVMGNWTVRFTTIGIANLTISAINATSYSEVYNDDLDTEDDLEILELKCGNNTFFNKYDNVFGDSSLILENSTLIKASESINQSLKVDSFFVEDYNCSSVGYYTVKVLTPGIHNQEFRFGIDVAYANNLANNPPITNVVVFSDMNSSKTYTIMDVS